MIISVSFSMYSLKNAGKGDQVVRVNFSKNLARQDGRIARFGKLNGETRCAVRAAAVPDRDTGPDEIFQKFGPRRPFTTFTTFAPLLLFSLWRSTFFWLVFLAVLLDHLSAILEICSLNWIMFQRGQNIVYSYNLYSGKHADRKRKHGEMVKDRC